MKHRRANGDTQSPKGVGRRRRGAKREPRLDGRLLPLCVNRLRRAVLDDPSRCDARLLPDEHGSDRRGRLESCRGVDYVTRHHRLAMSWAGVELHDRLARVYRDSHMQALLLGPIANRERGSDRALGIVAVGSRGSEDTHDGVANELLHRAAESLELRADALVVRRQDVSDVLGVELLGAGSEAHEIDEEYGHNAAFLTRAAWFGERRAARVAELRELGVVLPTAGAGEHEVEH